MNKQKRRKRVDQKIKWGSTNLYASPEAGDIILLSSKYTEQVTDQHIILIAAMGNSVFLSEARKTLFLSNKYIFCHCCSIKRSPKDIWSLVEFQKHESLLLFNGINFFSFNLNTKELFLCSLVSPHRHRSAFSSGGRLRMSSEGWFFLKPFVCWLAAFPLAAQPFPQLLFFNGDSHPGAVGT